MAQEPRMDRQFRQVPVLSQQARITVFILQLPLLELREYLEQEMWENPMLEDKKVEEEKGAGEVDTFQDRDDTDLQMQRPGDYDRDDDQRRMYLESLVTKEETLEDHLAWQLGMFLDGEDYKIGEYIIGSIDDNGYLKLSAEELAEKFDVEKPRLERILSLVQTFDPAGVAARDARECLMIQLKAQGKEDSLAYRIVEGYLEDLEKKDLAKIAKKLKADLPDVEKACRQINALDPKPGRGFTSEKAVWTVPDLVLTREGDDFTIEMNNRFMPALRVSSYYSKLMKNKGTDDHTKDFLKMKRKRAQWVVNAILQRQNTIQRIAEFVVDFQKGFFDSTEGEMKPLKLTDVAAELEISESTVSRAIAQKYIQTEMGTLPLKSFFSTALKQEDGRVVSAASVKDRIKELIDAEDGRKPLSDQRIVNMLKDEGVEVARRTVAKYRESMKILPAHLRKH